MENKKIEVELGSSVVYKGTATNPLNHDTVYRVSAIHISANGTMYELQNIGIFEAKEFEVLPKYLLITTQVPVEGQPMKGLRYDDKTGTFARSFTSLPALKVVAYKEYYRVPTLEAIYLVTVI